MWFDDVKIIQAMAKEQSARIQRFDVFESLPSTNDYLMGLAKSGVQDISVCLAAEQTAGRGQQGRRWVSPANANVYLSILWPFKKDLRELSLLSVEVSRAIISALQRHGVSHGLVLKHPNDVMFQNKKLAGVLVEIINRQPVLAVVGVGLNLNMPASTLIDQPWTDLHSIMGQSQLDQNKIIALLLGQLINTLSCV